LDLRPAEDGVVYVDRFGWYLGALVLVRSDGAVDMVEVDSQGVVPPIVSVQWPAPPDARFATASAAVSVGTVSVVLLDSLGRVWTHTGSSGSYPVGPRSAPDGVRYMDARVIGNVGIDDATVQRRGSTSGVFLLRSDGVLEVSGDQLGAPVRRDPVGGGYVGLGTGEGWPVALLDRGRAETLGMATYWPAHPENGWMPRSRVVPDGVHGWWFVQGASMERGVMFAMVRAPSGVKSYSQVVDVSEGWYTAPSGRETRVVYRGRDAVVVARVATRGAVKGGVVAVRYKGKVIGKVKVPASGLVRVKIDTSRFAVARGAERLPRTNKVSVRFEGTGTAKRSKPVTMYLSVYRAP
jgi:hypothetical protein